MIGETPARLATSRTVGIEISSSRQFAEYDNVTIFLHFFSHLSRGNFLNNLIIYPNINFGWRRSVSFADRAPPGCVHGSTRSTPPPSCTQLFIIDVQDFNTNIDSVPQGTGNALLLFRYDSMRNCQIEFSVHLLVWRKTSIKGLPAFRNKGIVSIGAGTSSHCPPSYRLPVQASFQVMWAGKYTLLEPASAARIGATRRSGPNIY